MPEIPEMENYKNHLLQSVLNKPIYTAKVHRPRSINVDEEVFLNYLSGRRFTEVKRRAKYLIFEIEKGLYLIAHLMLDGRLYFQPGGEVKPGQVFPIGLPGKPYVEIAFEDNSILYFCDLRLGYLHLVDKEVLRGIIQGLGLEPLGLEYNWNNFNKVMSKRRGMVKPLLMNQKVIAGIGNAYSNEILFASRILPDRVVPSLSEEEMQNLYQSIPRILNEALAKGGYIEEPFAPWDKVSGGAIPFFKVYDRAKEPCYICGTALMSREVGGRNAFYCPICQN